jgi:chromosome segregation ATPase
VHLEGRVSAVEEKIDRLRKELLESEEEKGKLLRELAMTTRSLDSLQRQRSELEIEHQRLSDRRFEQIQSEQSRHHDRISCLEEADWEISTGVSNLEKLNVQAQKLRAKSEAPAPSGKFSRQTLLAIVSGIVTAVATGLALAYQLLAGK